MTTITFDTHKFITTLKEAGFDEKQAEAVTTAIKDSIGETDIVTKEYFDYRLKAEIEASKSDMIKWIAGLLIAQAAVVAALVKLI